MWKVFVMCLRVVLDLTVSPDCECDVPVVQSLNPLVPQTFFSPSLSL